MCVLLLKKLPEIATSSTSHFLPWRSALRSLHSHLPPWWLLCAWLWKRACGIQTYLGKWKQKPTDNQAFQNFVMYRVRKDDRPGWFSVFNDGPVISWHSSKPPWYKPWKVYILPELGLVVSTTGPLIALVEHIRRPSANTARFWRSIVAVVTGEQTKQDRRIKMKMKLR